MRRPIEAVDGLPVLTSLDLGGRKVLTIVDRLEARDYTDLHALAGILGRRTCIEAALFMDPGARVNDIADAFTRVTSILDGRFPAGPEEAAAIKRYFTDWADELGATCARSVARLQPCLAAPSFVALDDRRAGRRERSPPSSPIG